MVLSVREGLERRGAYVSEMFDAEAQAGSTHLRFQLTLSDPHGTPFKDCSNSANRYRLDI